MQGVEAIIVGDGDVGASLQQHRQHVISLLADGVVQWRVALGILKRGETVLNFPLSDRSAIQTRKNDLSALTKHFERVNTWQG